MIPSISIVILNWNGEEYLRRFLPSVCQSADPDVEVVVCDNASSDGSINVLRTEFPEVRLIKNDLNHGFAGGYNRALTQIASDYIILLNSDVEVDSKWIRPLVEMMRTDENIAAVQPKILSVSDRQEFEYSGAAGGWMDMFGYPFCRGRIFDHVEKDTGQYNDPQEVFWASGAAMCVRREAWLRVGGFDEDFFAHMEEIDLCWRFKNLGYRIMYCPDSKVYHLGGGTLQAGSPYKTYLNFRNNLIMLQKNLPFIKAVLVISARMWLDLLSIFKFMADGQFASARAVSRAHRAFFFNFFDTAAKRRRVTRSSFNAAGLYNGSIVWQYFVRKKKLFSAIVKNSVAPADSHLVRNR